MKKGQYPKLHGTAINVLVKADKTYKLLPDIENIILVKLKKNLRFEGYVYFEPVLRQIICDAILHLKKFNPLYADVEINVDQIEQPLIELSDESEVSQNESQMKLPYCEVLNEENANKEEWIEETPDPQDIPQIHGY